MGTNVHLTPELEKFARDRVEEGRYNNVSEVVREGLRVLQDREAARARFEASLEEAIAEGDADGFVTLDELTLQMDQVIARAARA